MKTIVIYSVLVSSLFISACSTSLDVTGDYKEKLIVYGLLDAGQDTQYVKINKAFLGAGNAYEYALIKDSTQFKNPLDVKIKCDISGISYSLTPANYIIKDPGAFFYDTTGTGTNQTNVIYKMVTDGSPGHPHLNTNSIYELTATNGETGTVVTSKTLIVPDIANFLAPNPAGTTFSFVIAGFYPNYKFKVEWNSAQNARQYQVILRLHYTDSTTTGSVAKHLDYQMPALTTNGLSGGEDMTVELTGRDFYKYIGATLSDYSGLVVRKTGNVDILLVSGADDLVTFIDVNKPSTGIIQERPEFTNIVNGLGLFSSRLNRNPPYSRPLSGSSLDSLSGGQFTCKLKFTDPSGVWTGCH